MLIYGLLNRNNMKNILKTLSIIAVLGFASMSCEEKETFDMKNGGALVANVNPPHSQNFVYGVTPSISFGMDITDNGNSVTNVTMTKTLSTSLGTSAPVEIDVTSGDYSQTLDQLFADVPVEGNVLTEDDLLPGDFWMMTYVLTMGDGTVLNTDVTTKTGFSCPIGADFTGMYNMVDVTGSSAGGGAPVWGPGPVELVEAGDFDRSFDAIYLPIFDIGNGPETFTFKLECSLVKMAPDQGTGLACASSITFGPATTHSAFDPDDDSVIELTFTEDVTDDCGSKAQTIVRFEKVM